MSNPLTISHKIFFLLTIISFLFLTACQNIPPHQAYEGSPKTDSEIAIFYVPGQFNLLSIDGTKFKQLALRDGAMVKLLPGSHQFIIEYYDFFDLGGGEFEKVGSKPMSITLTVEAGKQYSVNSITFENVEKAQDFADKPSINIIDTTSKEAIPAKIKYNLYGKGLFTTLFGGSQPEPSQPLAPKENTKSITKTPGKNGKSLEMLKHWWEMADEKQQGDFRQWLKNQ